MTRDWISLNRNPAATHREAHVTRHCQCDQPSLAELLAAIQLLHVPLNRMEILMARASDEIRNLGTRFDGLSGVVTDIANDFDAFRQAMEAERENLTAEGQAALDEAKAKADAATERLNDLDVAVGDADGSDTPPADETQPQF